jgi:hypothetical protein
MGGIKEGKKGGRKSPVMSVVLTHGVAENARWALRVAGAVAGVGIAMALPGST